MYDIDGEHGCEARFPVNNLKFGLFLTQSHHMISDDLEYNIMFLSCYLHIDSYGHHQISLFVRKQFEYSSNISFCGWL